jgi:hypothetical protein
MVLDLDVLAAEIGKPLHEMDISEKREVVMLRNSRLLAFCTSSTPHPRCWLIATAGSYKHRKFWSDLGAQVIPINPGATVCKARIRAERSKRISASQIEAVDNWA